MTATPAPAARGSRASPTRGAVPTRCSSATRSRLAPLDRRDFAKTVAAAAATVVSRAWARGEGGAASRQLGKPRRLREGDLVGLLAPGGGVGVADVERAVSDSEAPGRRGK